MSDNILKVDHLTTAFKSKEGWVNVIEDVNFSVKKGEVLGIVGESGCGKSVTSLSILRLLPERLSKIVSGSVIFDGVDLLKLNKRQLRKYRGDGIAMVFQDSLSGLNPVVRIGDQLVEAILAHQNISKEAAQKLAVENLKKVGIPSPEKRILDYPHQLSGGMRQRVLIAMALSNHLNLLIADEPTTALDVTIQAQILDLLLELRDEYKMAIMIITHDMGVVYERTDKVMVMYAGQVVEYGSRDEVFRETLHPYTEGLLASIPKLDQDRDQLLPSIPGTVPASGDMPEGCRFASRCKYCKDQCLKASPPMWAQGEHQVRCWRYIND
ncbi:MAG: ABC transporter ATP-binding protein [Eubacteriales bacterium]|nr:ABC transporter ATP-binding protein [Eubacteriales bacterium]